MNKKIDLALIYGGRGLERNVSVKSAENLVRRLDDGLFSLLAVFIDECGRWVIASDKYTSPSEGLPTPSGSGIAVAPFKTAVGGGFITESGGLISVDAALPVLHGDFGEDGSVQGALVSAGIPIVGCSVEASALGSDKIYTKAVAEYLKIPTSPWIPAVDLPAKCALIRAEESLGYPMFIKPARLGSSFGAGAVRCREDFDKIYSKASILGCGRVLIERMIPVAAELECLYFSAEGKRYFTNIGEITYSSDFYDYDTKYGNGSSASISPRSAREGIYGERIREYSERIRELVGIEGLCRFDYFLDGDGGLFFNEINTMPGFTSHSLSPLLIEETGISLTEALSSLIREAVGRK